MPLASSLLIVLYWFVRIRNGTFELKLHTNNSNCGQLALVELECRIAKIKSLGLSAICVQPNASGSMKKLWNKVKFVHCRRWWSSRASGWYLRLTRRSPGEPTSTLQRNIPHVPFSVFFIHFLNSIFYGDIRLIATHPKKNTFLLSSSSLTRMNEKFNEIECLHHLQRFPILLKSVQWIMINFVLDVPVLNAEPNLSLGA